MKKIFLFLSAVLMSVLSLQATEVQSPLALSDFEATSDATWNAETGAVSTESTDWKGITHWYGELDASAYSYVVLELQAASSVAINFNIRYANETSAAIEIPAGKMIGYAPLSHSSINAIDIYLKDAGSASLKSLYLYNVVGKEDPVDFLDAPKTLANWAWDDILQIANTRFASAHAGDKIEITYTSEAHDAPNSSYASAVIRISETNDKLSDAFDSEIIQESQTDKTYSFILNATDVARLQEKGMYINGNKVVLSSVKLYTYTQQFMEEIPFSTFDTVQLEWGERLRQTTKPTFEAGNELRVSVFEIRNTENKQIYFGYDGTFDNFIAVTGSIDNEVPKVYSATLTPEQAIAINNSGKLFVTGTGVTINRFSYAKPRSIYTTLNHDEKEFDGSWGESLEFTSDKFSSLTVGDRICLNISALSSEGQQVQLLHGWTAFEPKAAYVFNANHAVPMTVSFVVSQDMLTALQADGLRVRGANYTVQDIYIQTAEAQTESYTLEVKAAGMATLVLPFNVPSLPEGVQAYKLTNDGSDEIVATEVSAIEADKPVLVVAAQGNHTFESELGGNADISGKNHWPVESYLNGALVGNYAPTLWVPQAGTPHGNNYVLQKHGEEAPAFYKVNSDDITLSPYRAYLSCSYPGNSSQAPMRIVFPNNAPTNVESIQQLAISSQKILRNGQLFILRNGVEYNVNGQIVK